MEIRCFGCGGSMGTNDAVPNERIKVWYGLHDEWGCGMAMTQGAWSYFSDHVLEQNRLPRSGERVNAVRPPTPVPVVVA